MTFTIEELTDIARDGFDGHTVERDGLRYQFAIHYDDVGVVDMVNEWDCYGKLAWPVRNRNTGYDERPPGFTGAARKFGPTQMCDTIWWEPYREGHTVYDSPEDVAFMRDLLDYGFVWVSLTVERHCDCCDQWVEIGHETLSGIESPLVGNGNYEYLASIFADLISEATHELEPA